MNRKIVPDWENIMTKSMAGNIVWFDNLNNEDASLNREIWVRSINWAGLQSLLIFWKKIIL